MDCAKDGLTEIGESTEKSNDIPCTLRIKALGLVTTTLGIYASWFIQEEKKRRLRTEFNSESQALLQIDVETADDGVLIWLQFQ